MLPRRKQKLKEVSQPLLIWLVEEVEVEHEEKFEEVLDSSLKFKSSWAIWEHYEGEKYEDSMKKVAWFNDVISFAEAWVNIPHRSIENFFYDSNKKTVQM